MAPLSFSFCILLIGIMLLDWAAQEFLGMPSTNARRFFTGALAGIGLGSFFWEGIVVSFRILEKTSIRGI